MYSVVLMAALTTGSDIPASYLCAPRRYTCNGCYGCYGNGWGGPWYAHGYGVGHGPSSFGSACFGCYGTSSFPDFGACYGGGWHGDGGWHGSPAAGPVYADSAVVPAPVVSPPAAAPAAPATTPPTMPPANEGNVVPPPKKEDGAAAANRGRVVVELPTDARLYIDDQLMKTASGRRVFRTPALDGDQTYYYILRAEVVREGATFTQTKRVVVRAGEVARASFTEESIVSASRPDASAKK
jgi:uncharacterized protein (TIGR03000 family)